MESHTSVDMQVSLSDEWFVSDYLWAKGS